MPLAYTTELASPEDQLVGWGLKIIIDGVRAAGWDVIEVAHPCPEELPPPDVWLCSLPYAGNMLYIKEFFSRTARQSLDRTERSGRTTFILGGHAVINTWPLLDVFDACFVGEGDEAIGRIMDNALDLDDLATVPGMHVAGRNTTLEFQLAKDLSKRGFYKASYNDDPGEGEKTLYLEVARGCQQGCRFCELGWAYGQNYTRRTREETEALMDSAVAMGYERKNIVLSAPDTDGVPWLSDMMVDGSYNARWRSTRVRPYLKTPELPYASGRGRIRFGIEGVNERLRTLCGKRITDDEVEAAIQRCQREGYRMVRLFFIAGLPTETQYDRMHLEVLLDILKRARFHQNHWKAFDVKITGLSPQPFTPFQRCGVKDALLALDGYRLLKMMKEKDDVAWRQVMIDAQATEADVLKMMGPGELLRYLRVRPEGDVPGPAQKRWRVVAGWCKAAGIDYRNVLRQYGLDEPLPWDHVTHPMGDRLRRAEVRAWQAIEREKAQIVRLANAR
jgi:hypothetical protein